MEKNTVTIEIKQEVSITLLWIVAGVIIATVTYLLFSGSTDMWPAMNATGIATAVYLIALLIYVLRNPISSKFKVLIALCAIVVLGLGTFDWVRMQDHGRWRAETIKRIRTVIWRGITIYHMNPEMLKTLKEFYHPTSKQRENFAEVFTRRHPGVTVGSNIYKPDWEGDSLRIIVTKLEANRIELLSQHPYATGRDPSFKNYGGHIGMFQEKIILTEKGIEYVSEN